HHVNPARLQTKRRHRPSRRRQFLELAYTLDSQEPNSLFSNATSRRLKVRSIEERGTRCERIQQVPDMIAPRVKESAAVIIPESRERTCLTHGGDDVKHFFCGLIEL